MSPVRTRQANIEALMAVVERCLPCTKPVLVPPINDDDIHRIRLTNTISIHIDRGVHIVKEIQDKHVSSKQVRSASDMVRWFNTMLDGNSRV